MSEPAADVSATVEYSMDKWLLDRVPWAMWSCAAGLAVVLHADSRGRNGAVLAFVYLALLGLAFAGWAATTLIDRSTPFLVSIAIGTAIALVVVVVIIAVTGTVGRSVPRGTLWWSGLVDPPLHVFGWMLIYLGGGYIGYALFRHYRPGRPIVVLSPAGVAFHRSWLRNLLIPWQDIQGVGHLDTSSAGAPASPNRHAAVVVVTRDFYERDIAPKLSFLAPPGSEAMFRPKGALMQMVLNCADVAVGPEDYRVPAEARWRTFRDRPAAAVPAAGPQGTRIRYGRWSIDGSWWQAIMFLAPLIGIIAVVLHAKGFWPA